MYKNAPKIAGPPLEAVALDVWAASHHIPPLSDPQQVVSQPAAIISNNSLHVVKYLAEFVGSEEAVIWEALGIS